MSYSSPQLVTIGAIPQVLISSGKGIASVAPAAGTLLWQNAWGPGIVQPAQTGEGDLLICATDSGGGLGMRRIAAGHSADGWTVQERWTTKALKPYFNDFVVHKGHAFGFDGNILACIDLKDGARKEGRSIRERPACTAS